MATLYKKTGKKFFVGHRPGVQRERWRGRNIKKKKRAWRDLREREGLGYLYASSLWMDEVCPEAVTSFSGLCVGMFPPSQAHPKSDDFGFKLEALFIHDTMTL